MNTRMVLSQAITVIALFSAPFSRAQGTAFSYQGFLTDSGAPANRSYDLTFSLFGSDHGPDQIGDTVTNTAVGITNGVFTVPLDFGPGNFSGADRWLEIGVRTNGGDAFVMLNPRQKIAATPYAITASNLTGIVPDGGIAGSYSNSVTFNNSGNRFNGDGSGLTGINAANISTGQLAVGRGGTGSDTAPGARLLLGAAASGANSDITSLSGLSTPLSIEQGGTGAGTASNGLLNLGGASLTQSNVFSGINVLSNAANIFAGSFAGDGSGLSNINFAGLTGTLPSSQLAGTYSGAVAFNNPSDLFSGSFHGDGSALTGLNASGFMSGVVPLIHGGTGADTASGARAALGAAASGTNSDITSLSGLITPLSIDQGGTGAGTASGGLLNLGGASLTQSNFFSGANILSNAANTFAGSFAGDGSGLHNLNAAGLTGVLSSSLLAGNYSGLVTFSNPGNLFNGSFQGDGSGLTGLNVGGFISGVVPLIHGGTGAGTASGARGSLGAAASGANSDITSLSGLSTALSLAQGGTGAGTASNALVNLGAASLTASNTFSGINVLSNAANSFFGNFSGVGAGLSNINFANLIGTLPSPQLAGTYSSAVTFNNPADAFNGSFTGSFTGDGSALNNLNAASISSGTLPLARGGTGAGSAAGARATLGAAASGANSDITSLSALSIPLSLAQGGTGAGTASNALVNLGAASLTASNTFSGINVLSNAANSFFGNFNGVGAGLSNINFTALTGTLPSSQLAGTYSSAVTFNNPADAFNGSFTGDGSALNNLNAASISSGTLPLARGGTGAGSAAGARATLGAATSGANSDITSLSALSIPLSLAQGGTGAGTVSNALVNLGAASLTASNTFSGINVLSNAANSFVGNFSGVGAGLSNINFAGLTGTLPSSQLAGTYSSAVTFNNPADAFNGSFNGDGSALSNLNWASLIGALPSSQLAGAYSQAVTFNNSANAFIGSFSGNGSGVTNVNASTLAGLSASNLWQLGGNAGTIPGVNFLGTTDNQPLMLKATAGIGINTNNPAGKAFAINGSAGLSGTNTWEFGSDVSGKQANAGKIGYQTLTPGSLDIVGAGNSVVSRKIKFWTEGGATFNGTGTNALMTITNTVDEQTSMLFAAPFSTWRVGQNKPPDAPGAFDSFFIYQQNAGATRLLITSDGRVGIGTNNPVFPLELGNGAYCTAGGQWTSVSDRNAKEDFTPINPCQVLAKVAALPISQWRYKAETNAVKHLGPTAQDFHAAFGLGESDRAIGSVDADGVALAAIQGLNQKVEDDQAALRQQLARQSAQLALMEKQLTAQQEQIEELRSALKSSATRNAER